MNPTGRQTSKAARLTLNKRIAAAPTHAQKWEIALHGDNAPTAVQLLPMEAFGLREPSAHGEEWRTKAIKQAKERFAEILFPALMNDNPQPFLDLIDAMARRRKTQVSFDEFIRLHQEALKKKPSKKEMGRRLRLALLSARPDDLASMRAVMGYLDSCQVEYSDESHVRRVMRELDVHLLKSGDTVFFRWSQIDLSTGQPKKWLYPRKLTVGQNGTTANFGMTRKEYDKLNGCKAHYVQSSVPDK